MIATLPSLLFILPPPSVPKIARKEASYPGHDPLLAVTPEKPFCHDVNAAHKAVCLVFKPGRQS